MIGLEVKSPDLQKVIVKLKNFGKDISLISEPLEDSARYMQQQAIANFAARGKLMQPEGWPKLEKSTVRMKAKEWPGRPMMVREGKLRSSFEIEGPRIGKDFGEIEIYNPVHYAVEHQEAWGLLPQRILLRFQKQHIQTITNIFTRWVEKITNKNFK